MFQSSKPFWSRFPGLTYRSWDFQLISICPKQKSPNGNIRAAVDQYGSAIGFIILVKIKCQRIRRLDDDAADIVQLEILIIFLFKRVNIHLVQYFLYAAAG